MDGVSWLEGVGVTEDSVGLVIVDNVMVGSRSDSGGMGEGPGMELSSIDSVLISNEGVGISDSVISGDDGVSSSDGSVGDVGVSVVGDGARSVGACSDGSLGTYVDGGSGTSTASNSNSLGIGDGDGKSSISGENSREYTGANTGDGADEGMVGISDGVCRLNSSLSFSLITGVLSLHLQSAVLKSVDTSDAQISAVIYSVGAGVVHTGTVWNSVSTSDSHFRAVSYSVSHSIAVSYSDGMVERLLNDAVDGDGEGAV